jgi:hypothetical protein
VTAVMPTLVRALAAVDVATARALLVRRLDD